MFKWYVINVLAGQELSVRDIINKEIVKRQMTEIVREIFVPSEQVTKFTRGKKVSIERKFYPGYVFLHADLTDPLWNLIKAAPNVRDLIQGAGKPLLVKDKEIDYIKKQLVEGAPIGDLEVLFDVAESVKIMDGPFKSFVGVIEEVDGFRQKLKVSVSIFGRDTPVELGFNQVQKL